jgi:hypothetical protein
VHISYGRRRGSRPWKSVCVCASCVVTADKGRGKRGTCGEKTGPNRVWESSRRKRAIEGKISSRFRAFLSTFGNHGFPSMSIFADSLLHHHRTCAER